MHQAQTSEGAIHEAQTFEGAMCKVRTSEGAIYEAQTSERAIHKAPASERKIHMHGAQTFERAIREAQTSERTIHMHGAKTSEGTIQHNPSNVILFLSNRVVEAMAEFHTVKLPENMLENAKSEKYTILNTALRNNTIKQEIINKLEHYEFKLGLVHGDLHLDNIIVNDHEEAVYLIDYENTHYGWVAYDWVAANELSIGKVAKQRNFRKKLLEVYLKRVAELEGRTASDVTRSDVEKLHKQIVEIDHIWDTL